MEEHLVKINKWLYPVSFLYGMGVGLRNKLFDWGILQSKSFDIPIICIGNIAVGGTGKTPHTEYLINLLKDKYRVAVLSRGYKRRTKGYVLSDSGSSVRSIGDEPYQIKKKFPHITVAVDEKRVRGIENLCKLDKPKIELILLDDAFQHRYVEAGMNIILTDYHRLFCDDALLPAGRLREPEKAKNRAQLVIVTKCPEDIKPIDYNIIAKRLGLFPYQKLFFSSFQYGNLIPVFPKTNITARNLSSLKRSEHVLLVTGIASPTIMKEEICRYTRHVELLSFGDHYNFKNKDIKLITDQFNKLQGEKIIITTEKDATRLATHPAISEELKKHIYALPIEIKILQNQEDTFNKTIIDYVRADKRNGIIP
ncbi:tetraacyldisaccharide 4'-kinase [Bacteroides sp. 51]|uniref:tetraacyldisaccharide 4'-kinase n=1 Tax=Bacteroides sp. 51 TaxID=2302938 RepID=UPI0013D602F8|nr:tetraacyldisaccharide 4'-kinase [Bacteroides sp. 51]NDV84443.1 tetraacyldisaccharide 4'-kinase [Bacteroides sp. 51]